MEVKPGYKQTELGLMPEDWDPVSVGQVACVKGGKRLPAGYSLSERPTPYPYLRVSDMHSGGIDTSNLRYIPECAFPAIRAYRIYQSDLFISVAGTLGIVGVVPPPLDGANLTENADRITDLRCDRDYLKYWLMSAPIQTTIAAIRTVGAQPKLALGRIAQFRIALPKDVAEQRAIGKTLGDVDALLNGIDRLIAKKRELKQAAVQQLVTGGTRLPGWRAPWTEKPLAHAGRCLRGVSYQGDRDLSPHDTDETRRLLRANNVQEGLVTVEDLQFVSTRCVDQQQILRPGDVLVCMANGSRDLVGKAAMFSLQDGFKYTFGAFMGCFRPDSTVSDARFISKVFQTSEYRRQLNNALAGSSINNLRPSAIEAMVFRFPSLDEQEAIAEVLFDMDAELAALEAREEKTRLLKQGMMQELLTGRIRLV